MTAAKFEQVERRVIAAIQTPDTRMSRKDVTGKYVVKVVVKHPQSRTVIQLEVIIFLHKSNQQTTSLTPMYKNDRTIMKPIGRLASSAE
jgi:hypothetical protein